MRGTSLFIWVLIMICFIGCKQVAYKAPPPLPGSSYFPQTYGSTWQYRDSVYGLPTDTFPLKGVRSDIVTYTMNGSTTDFNSMICYNATVVSQLYGNGTAYYYAKDHTFGLFSQSPPWGFATLQFLVDKEPAGFSWASSPSLYLVLHGSPVRAITTILETNTNRVVNGQTFTSVVHSSLNYQININNAGYHNIAYFDFYIAPGVGIIEKDASYYGLLNETETILSYTIK
jgi:hypothetical protein